MTIDSARPSNRNTTEPRADRIARYLAAIRDGATMAKIAAGDGITRQAVSDFLLRRGIEERSGQHSPIHAAIVAAYKSGAAIIDIARAVNVTRDTVTNVLKKAGIAPARYRQSRATITRIGAKKARYAAMIAEGKNQTAIARAEGVAPSTVCKALKKEARR